MFRHAFADLHQRVLNMARLLRVLEILTDLLVRELPSEPGVPPEQKGHEHDQPRGHEEQDAIAGGHPAPRTGAYMGRSRHNVIALSSWHLGSGHSGFMQRSQ